MARKPPRKRSKTFDDAHDHTAAAVGSTPAKLSEDETVPRNLTTKRTSTKTAALTLAPPPAEHSSSSEDDIEVVLSDCDDEDACSQQAETADQQQSQARRSPALSCVSL